MSEQPTSPTATYARRIGLFSATMLVVGVTAWKVPALRKLDELT